MTGKAAGKFLIAGLICYLGANLFEGCSGRSVDYSIEDATERPESVQKAKGLGQFEGASVWEDEWTAVNAKQNIVTLQINAGIRLPEADQMSVAEVKEAEMHTDFKRRVAEGVFEKGSICYFDIDHLPKEDLIKLREQEQKSYDFYDGTTVDPADLEQMEEIQENIRILDERIPGAKEAYTPAKDFSADQYLGKFGGNVYEVTFWSRETDGGNMELQEVDFKPRDIRQFCPEELKDVSDESELVYLPYTDSYTVLNECELSEEAAREIADRFVERTGMEYPVYAYSMPLAWTKIDGDGRVKESCDGYVFYYDAGVDGVSFVMFGTEWQYQNYDKKKESEPEWYSMNARMEVYVNGNGVISAKAQNPVEFTGVSQSVGLLALEDVKNIMKEAVTEHFGDFRFHYSSEDWLVKFNELELVYFRIRDKENKRHYSYVPTWRLGEIYHYENDHMMIMNNCVLINAVDGSVINFYEEV